MFTTCLLLLWLCAHISAHLQGVILPSVDQWNSLNGVAAVLGLCTSSSAYVPARVHPQQGSDKKKSGWAPFIHKTAAHWPMKQKKQFDFLGRLYGCHVVGLVQHAH